MEQAGRRSSFQDETLIEIETDKVIMEVPSPADGVLVEIIVQSGEDVESEQLLAKIDTAATATAAAPAAEAKEEAAPAEP
ncbi:Dihydrolipoyllysine-residue succinyltransferase component of 2-oxoglutarate dehydrogenase complex [Oligella ureolytica]